MPTETSRSSRWRLAALALAMLLPSLGTSIANVALPTLRDSFAAPGQEVQWVIIAYLLAITCLIVTAGRFGDLWGRRRMLLAGIGVFVLASAGAAMASQLWVLVAARGLQGAGAALMMALALAMVTDLIPKERIGRAIGLLGTMSALGTALGPSLGGVLIGAFGWRVVFAVMALAGGGAFLLASRTLPRNPQVARQRPSLDLPGIVLLAASLGAYALSTTLETGLPIRVALAAGSVLGLVAFVAVESRAASPLIQLRLLREAELATGLVALGLVSAILMTTLVVGPFYLSGALGLGPTATGLVMTLGPSIVVLAGVPAGRMVDRLGPQAVIFAGLGGVVLGSGLMSWLPGLLGVGGYVASLAVITLGYALFQVANNAAIMGTATADRRGVTSALLALARNLGLVTGASAMGALFVLGSAGSLGPDAGEAGFQVTFTVATALGALALAATWWGHGPRSPVRSGQSL